MKIIHDQTPQFQNYEVFVTQESRTPLWDKMFDVNREIKLTRVLEADDVTGLVVRQVEDEYGDAVFTNGFENISISNECKLLLLVPPIREAFLLSKFVPKTVSTYEKNVRIVNKNPTVSIAVNVQQELEPANA